MWAKGDAMTCEEHVGQMVRREGNRVAECATESCVTMLSQMIGLTTFELTWVSDCAV